MSDHMDLEWRWPTTYDYRDLLRPWLWGRHGASDLRVLSPMSILVLPVTGVTVFGACRGRIVAGSVTGVDWRWEVVWVGDQPFKMSGTLWAEPD
jgi:hypothetical protein